MCKFFFLTKTAKETNIENFRPRCYLAKVTLNFFSPVIKQKSKKVHNK